MRRNPMSRPQVQIQARANRILLAQGWSGSQVCRALKITNETFFRRVALAPDSVETGDSPYATVRGGSYGAYRIGSEAEARLGRV
jgi:hypothetical protein